MATLHFISRLNNYNGTVRCWAVQVMPLPGINRKHVSLNFLTITLFYLDLHLNENNLPSKNLKI